LAGLEGIQRLYNVDLVALVSYDQVTHSGDMKYRSLAYLTIIGAFVVPGSEHDVTTLVDLAAVDPKTRSLVLRAGGTDTRHGTSTLVDRSKETRATSAQSFSTATDAMIEHFDLALASFEAEVRAGKAEVRVVNKDGSPRGGGGAFGALALLLFVPLLVLRRRAAR
jgi:rhombotail lipoprotein